MHHHTEPEDRRRFLARIGATVAAGVGFVALGARPAGARTQPCGYYCYVAGCPGNCLSPCNEFRCVNLCTYEETYQCINHSCGGFCVSSAC